MYVGEGEGGGGMRKRVRGEKLNKWQRADLGDGGSYSKSRLHARVSVLAGGVVGWLFWCASGA